MGAGKDGRRGKERQKLEKKVLVLAGKNIPGVGAIRWIALGYSACRSVV
jgi:hypothetical protein